LLKNLLQSQVNRLVGLDERPIEIEDDSADPFFQVSEDVMKVLKGVAGDVLIDAVRVEEVFGKDEIRFTGRTPVGETISDEEDPFIFFAVIPNDLLLAGAAKTAFLADIGKGDICPSVTQKMGGVGIERNFREVMGFEYGPNIEIETVTYNLYLDIVLTTKLIERFEVGIDMGMFPDKTKDTLFITL
jgi:hypothetical protein